MGQVLLNGLIAGAIYGLIALGFSLTVHTTRFFDFSVAATLTVAAYATAAVSDLTGLHAPLILVAAGAVAGALVGTASFGLVYAPLINRRASNLVLLLASLGLMTVIVNGVSMVFGDQPRTVLIGSDPGGFYVGIGWLTSIQVWTVTVTLTCSGAFWWLIHRTSWGRALRAVGNDSELARYVGLPVLRIMHMSVLLGSLMIAIAGSLAALDVGLRPSLGFRLLLPAAVSVVIMGANQLAAATAGGILLGLLQQFAGWRFSAAWQDAALFAVLLVFLFTRPSGVLGFVSTKGSV